MRLGLHFHIRNFARASASLNSPKAEFSAVAAAPKPQREASLSTTAGGAVADIAGDDDDDLDIIRKPPATVCNKPSFSPYLLQPRLVVYDGVCPLCHSGVKWIIGADKNRKIKFCCLQSKAAEPYLKLCGVEREDVLGRFIFIEGLGQYHQASSAALKVLSYLPFPYSALSSLLVIPTPLRDAVYDYTAKRRYEWCAKVEDRLVMHEPELLERFIDREEILEKLRSDS